MSLDVLITGGSGYLGQFLLQALAQEQRPTAPTPDGGGNGGNAPAATATATPTQQPQPPLIRRLAYTYLANPLANAPAPGFKVDLDASEDGGRAALAVALQQGLGLGAANPRRSPRRAVVINCVAISTPATCERDYERALRINVPTALTDAAKEVAARAQGGDKDANDDANPNVPTIIHLSTDQVYAGEGRGMWREDDATPESPANAYGRSKHAAERHLLERWPPGRHVSLRASLIYGPQAPLAPVPRPLFVQFCAKVVKQGEPVTFFEDEWRSAVLASDIVAVVLRMLRGIAREAEGVEAGGAGSAAAEGAVAAPAAPAAAPWPLPLPAYNMGGPERLSRVDMARLVARAVLPSVGGGEEAEAAAARAIVPAPSSSVPAEKRGYESPRDISMDPAALLRDLGEFRLTRMEEALPGVLGVGGEGAA
jgi:dTDP-4-dehydrorhamnose reductase